MLLLVGAVAGTVRAEQEDDSIPDGVGEMEQTPSLSGPQQESWASGEVETMRRLSHRIQGLLNQARREQDILMIPCLNDKLTQINVTIRSFEDRMEQHSESLRSGNTERRDHHYRIMVILSQRSRVLRSEADACIGSDDISFGRTQVETEIDPNITEDDATEWPVDEGDVTRPPSASGYY